MISFIYHIKIVSRILFFFCASFAAGQPGRENDFPDRDTQFQTQISSSLSFQGLEKAKSNLKTFPEFPTAWQPWVKQPYTSHLHGHLLIISLGKKKGSIPVGLEFS